MTEVAGALPAGDEAVDAGEFAELVRRAAHRLLGEDPIARGC
jgi:hypothetical protein